MSTSLATYRALIPAHDAIPDATVSAWLTLAATQLAAAAFGSLYQHACVFYAASGLDPLVQVGQLPMANGQICAPPAPSEGKQAVADPDNVYWQRFLYIRDSRAAGAPMVVLPTAAGVV